VKIRSLVLSLVVCISVIFSHPVNAQTSFNGDPIIKVVEHGSINNICVDEKNKDGYFKDKRNYTTRKGKKAKYLATTVIGHRNNDEWFPDEIDLFGGVTNDPTKVEKPFMLVMIRKNGQKYCPSTPWYQFTTKTGKKGGIPGANYGNAIHNRPRVIEAFLAVYDE
jgi:hypothetical protein